MLEKEPAGGHERKERASWDRGQKPETVCDAATTSWSWQREENGHVGSRESGQAEGKELEQLTRGGHVLGLIGLPVTCKAELLGSQKWALVLR